MTKTWIFQASSKTFEIDRFIDLKPPSCLWRVSRFASEIEVGDRVFLWRAKGSGPVDGGIFGRGEIVESARPRAPDHRQRELWKKAADRTSVEPRAIVGSVLILDPKARIARSLLVDDPVAGGLSVLSQPRGTNFAVSDEQAARVENLLLRTGQPWSRSELEVVWAAFVRSGSPPDGRLSEAAAYAAAATIGRPASSIWGKASRFGDFASGRPIEPALVETLEWEVWNSGSGTAA
jgi:hypothetical protein